MTIEHADDGWWLVEGERRQGPYGSNAEAWRALDRMEGQPLNRAESVTDWRLQREMRGE
jgi:hypothetical protein